MTRALPLSLCLVALTSGCRTPATYDVRYHDPGRVRAVLSDSFEAPVESLAARVAGPGVPFRAAPVSVLGAELPDYAAHVDRAPDGSLVFRFTPEVGRTETRPMVNPQGRLMLTFPTATGDLLDFPGFHQRGVTAIGSAGPLSQANGEVGLHFVYRPDYDTQRALGRTASVEIALLTPRDNVAGVFRQERPPRGALWLGFAVSAVILAGGTFIAVPESGDSESVRDVRLSIGLPLVGVGLIAGIWSSLMLLRPDRDVPVPLDAASGSP